MWNSCIAYMEPGCLGPESIINNSLEHGDLCGKALMQWEWESFHCFFPLFVSLIAPWSCFLQGRMVLTKHRLMFNVVLATLLRIRLCTDTGISSSDHAVFIFFIPSWLSLVDLLLYIPKVRQARNHIRRITKERSSQCAQVTLQKGQTMWKTKTFCNLQLNH